MQEQTHNQPTEEKCAETDCVGIASLPHRSIVLAIDQGSSRAAVGLRLIRVDALEADEPFPVDWLIGCQAVSTFFVILKASSSCLKLKAAVHRYSLIGGASCSRFIGFKAEVNIGGHRKYERTCLSRFVSSRHDNVTVLVTVKYEQKGELIPRNKLNLFFVDDVILVRCNAARVNIEANHASYQVGTYVLLPGFLWPA